MPYPGSIDAMTFGQFGSIYLKTASTTITAPTSKLITAITMLEETQFADLEAKDSAQSFNTDAGGAGTGGETLTSTQVFPRGVTIYGKWKSLSLTSGSVIAYVGV